jgi:hypothetical protein
MRAEVEFESTIKQIHFFNLEEWGAVYAKSPEEQFVDYQVSNPNIFKIDRINGWPRIKKLVLDDQRPAEIAAAELWLFPFDIAIASLEIKHRGSTADLRKLSLRVKANTELKAYAEKIAGSQFATHGCQLLGDEDHQYIQVSQPLRETMIDESCQDLTGILTGDDGEFSEKYVEEILDDTIPYMPNAFACIGSRCLIEVNSKLDDLFCLWLFQLAFANKSLEVEKFLDERLRKTYELLARPRSFLPVPSFSHRALREANPFDAQTLQIVDQFLTPMEISGTGFFSLANDTIRTVLDIDGWQTFIKEKYDDLEDSYQHLEDIYSLKNQEFIEWLIILFLVLSSVVAAAVA